MSHLSRLGSRINGGAGNWGVPSHIVRLKCQYLDIFGSPPCKDKCGVPLSRR